MRTYTVLLLVFVGLSWKPGCVLPLSEEDLSCSSPTPNFPRKSRSWFEYFFQNNLVVTHLVILTGIASYSYSMFNVLVVRYGTHILGGVFVPISLSHRIFLCFLKPFWSPLKTLTLWCCLPNLTESYSFVHGIFCLDIFGHIVWERKHVHAKCRFSA